MKIHAQGKQELKRRVTVGDNVQNFTTTLNSTVNGRAFSSQWGKKIGVRLVTGRWTVGQCKCFPLRQEIRRPSVNIKGSSEDFGGIGTSVWRISSWQRGGNEVTASPLSSLTAVDILLHLLADIQDFNLLNAQVSQDSGTISYEIQIIKKMLLTYSTESWLSLSCQSCCFTLRFLKHQITNYNEQLEHSSGWKERPKMTETIFEKNVLNLFFDFFSIGPSANLEEAEFMTCTAASH